MIQWRRSEEPGVVIGQALEHSIQDPFTGEITVRALLFPRPGTECGVPDDGGVEPSTDARVIQFPRPARSNWYYARKAALLMIDSAPELLHDIWRALLAKARTWRHSR